MLTMVRAEERPARLPRVALSPEVVDRLLYYASRAPSPHNAQGWRIGFSGDRFTFRLDEDRQVLHELDPNAREGELACGAAVANLEAAAAALGYRTTTSWRPTTADFRLLAEVVLEREAPADETLLAPIRDRAVNRSAYAPEPVPPALLAEFRGIAAAEGLTLSVVTGDAVARVASLVSRAGRLKLLHGKTGRELYDLMRFSPRDAAATRDGLDLSLFDLPKGGAKASSLLLHPSFLSRLPFVARTLAKQAEADPIASSPAVCLLYADSDGEDVFLEGGRAFQRIALAATAGGFALQPHSAAVEVALALPGALDPALPADEVREIAAALRRAFGVVDRGRPIVLFRLGRPTRAAARRSLRQSPRLRRRDDAAAEHYVEMTRRNKPVIGEAEQEALANLRVLFAGCGSIGGAPVEVLARLGLQTFVLAEPGTYDLNNLNRQAAVLADVGRNKADVLADRVRAVNPHASALVERSGVTAANVDWLVGTTDVIVDGVDVTEPSGIAAKRLLHDEAWRQRRVVITGLDIGGTQLVRVFDYRDPKVRPFGGRMGGVAADVAPVDFLARLIAPLDMPMEMLPYTEAMIRGSAGSPPQLAPTASLFGVLAAWAVLDLACGRPLKKRVLVDLPGLFMPFRRRMMMHLVRVVRLAKLKILLEVTRARR